MELDKILNDFLEEKEIKKEKTDLNEAAFLSIRNLSDEDYEDYDEEEEDEEDEEDEDEDEEVEEIDILKITDIEKIKIALDILSNVNNDFPKLENVIMHLQDIVEDNEDY